MNPHTRIICRIYIRFGLDLHNLVYTLVSELNKYLGFADECGSIALLRNTPPVVTPNSCNTVQQIMCIMHSFMRVIVAVLLDMEGKCSEKLMVF